MSRQQREAELRALYGPKYGAVIVQEMGGPKRDRKKELNEQIAGSFQEGTLANLIERALTAEDTGPRRPDLRKFGPAAASTFPLTAGSLAAAKIRGLDVEETPEGAYVIERSQPSDLNYGQALGEAIWKNPGLTPQQEEGVYRHELGHVSQARDLGLAFPIANTADQIRALLTGQDPQDAHFEVTADERGRELLEDPQMERAFRR